MPFRTALKWLAFACLCFFPAIALGQERITTVKVGPYGDQVRIIVALIDPSPDGYKMQSMIIDLTPAKNKGDQPLSVQVDLTSTVRSLSTGKKQQYILLMRWKGPGEVELKCEGKWAKQDQTAPARVVETVKAVVENVPLNTKTPTDVTLPQEIGQRVSAALDSLGGKDLPCVRDIH